MTTELFAYDVAPFLKDGDAIEAYLDACLEEGGLTLFLKAVGEVARARGMTKIAGAAGVTRNSLYKSLAEEGNPSLATMDRVLGAMGLRFAIERIGSKGAGVAEVARKKSAVRIADGDGAVGTTVRGGRVVPGAYSLKQARSVVMTQGSTMAAGKKSGGGSGTNPRSSRTGAPSKVGLVKKNQASTTTKVRSRPRKGTR